MNWTRRQAWATVAALSIIIFAAAAPLAQEPAALGALPFSADQVMAKVADKEKLFSDSTDAVMLMTLIDKNGKTQKRRFRIQRFKYDVLIRFLEPLDVKDAGYLVKKDAAGKMRTYYYLPPPTDDYREIAVDDPGGSGVAFLGSDYELDDFQLRSPQRSVNTLARTEVLKTGSGDIECYVIESVPAPGAHYKYSKVVSWIRTDYWLPMKVRFYHPEEVLVKEMRALGYRTADGIKILSRSQMRTVKSNHLTILEFVEVKFGARYPEDHFTISNLTRPPVE